MQTPPKASRILGQCRKPCLFQTRPLRLTRSIGKVRRDQMRAVDLGKCAIDPR